MSLLERSFHLAHDIFPAGGTCLEFGVFRGGTFVYQAEQIKSKYTSSKLIGFDSWQGLPSETEGVWAPDRHAEGEYAAPKTEVLSRLSNSGITYGDDSRFQLVDGFYSHSLTDSVRDEIDSLIFVNVDVDIYRSTIELLDFIGPLLRPGVVIYWDDWKDPRDQHSQDWGEHRAWADWLSTNKDIQAETIEINPVNQVMMVVTHANGKSLEAPLPTLSKIRSIAMDRYLNPPSLRKLTDREIVVGIARKKLGKVKLLRQLTGRD